MSSKVFWPRPNVESAILDIRPQTVLRDRLSDRRQFHQLIRGIFVHRRKFLRSALASAVKDKLSKSDVDVILEEMELGPDARAEQLSVDQMIELFECVRKRNVIEVEDTNPKAQTTSFGFVE
jgi:16S rRNA (adenine1518-N6/adenine1519-N6)-dimethyltransferase